MGLKFRRGTTAQKSGSLAFGEPYVNTDLGTLQIGGASGDITLGASGTGSAGQFSSISGSGLDITGNANIGGNLTIGGAITIGDNVSDTVNVVASLSSSLIPSTTNVFDLGTTSKLWKDVYIASGSNGIKFVDGVGATVATLDARIVGGYDSAFTTFSGMVQYIVREDQTNYFTGSQFVSGNLNITGSIIPGETNTYDLGSIDKFFRDLYISTGSIKMVSNGVVVSTLSNTGNGMIMDQGLTAKGDSSFGTSSAAVTAVTGSLKVSGSISLIGTLSASTITGIGNVSLYSTSVDSRLVAAESFSSSLDSTFATDASVTIVSASAWGAFQSASAYSASASTDISASNAARVALSASVASRVTTLEGKDISITLTGDVTGTGTITDLANVSFATTIAADSVALGTDTTGNYVATMTEGAGITVGTATGEGSTPVITNTGVTSNVAGTGISVSGATGAVTITNSGVTSAVAGTGVSVSAGTGAVTFSIGQAVATNSAVSFASVSATGDIVAFSGSDRRLKNNIVNISDALNKVKQLNGVTWEWNEDANEVTKTAPSTGLIAQEVQAVLPEVVKEREDGYLGIDYSKMVGLLVEAIKEQQTQIAELKAEVEALKK